MKLSPVPAVRRISRIGLALIGAAACGSVPIDPGPRISPVPKGVIRGTIVYQGPRPCSRNGHIVGNAIVLVFDRRNPPPPRGLATSAVNFADVTGDVLFGNEPRYAGPNTYCPREAGFTETVMASAPFVVAPFSGGSYEIDAFFDTTGNFLPEFKIRNLPERGDVVGGGIDTADAIKPANAGNPNYQPRFVPVNVGVAQPLEAGAPPGSIPDYVVPDSGFVADDVTVTVGALLPTTRPYFFARGEQVTFDLATATLSASITQSSDGAATDSNGIAGTNETDPDAMPILTIPQDVGVLAPPAQISLVSANYFESKFPHIRLEWGVPAAELGPAVASPFGMQVAPFGPGAGFSVWQNAVVDPATGMYAPQEIPEGNGVPELWPQVVLVKMTDPQATTPQPLVVLEGITLLGQGASDSLVGTVLAASTGLFTAGDANGPRPVVSAQDHLTVILRPSVLCFPSAFGRGTLVTPHPKATTADVDCSSNPCVPNGTPDQPIAPADLLMQPALASLAGASAVGCLPTGRYAINVVYPDGQAWTVPNEAGVCSGTEGATDSKNGTCTRSPRPVLHSQGARAVVEIVGADDPAYCLANGPPDACVRSQ
jgi:hypothetical protein